MTRNSLAILLLGLLLVQGGFQRTYDELFKEYCSDDFLDDLDMTEEERQDERDSQRSIYIKAESVLDAINGHGTSGVFKDAGGAIVVMIILTLLCLFSFIAFLAFCCCCDRANNGTMEKAKIFLIIALVFLVVFIALYITILVFLGKMDQTKDNTNCGIAIIPKDLLDGVSHNDYKFIGFKKLNATLSGFREELGQINSLQNDFQRIESENLPAATMSAIQSLTGFSNKYNDKTTTDGTGVKTRPLTVQNLTTHVNDAIHTEFKAYDQVAIKVTEAARTGRSYASNNSVSAVQTSLDNITKQIDDIVFQIDDTFGTMVEGADYFNQYAPIGYWISFALGLAIAILAVLAVIFIFFMIKNSHDKCRMGVKVCLAVNGFLIFIFGIIAIILLIGSVGIGTICHEVGRILTAPNVNTVIESYGYNLDPFVDKVINECLPRGASGDLSKIIDTNALIFKQVEGFLDGLSLYNELKANLTNTDTTSPTIKGTVEIWENYRLSYWPDHLNTVSTLKEFNDLIKCSDVKFELNAKNCTSSSGCRGVFDTVSYNAPSCSSNQAQANNYWTTLKAFTTEENTLLGNMITDLSGPDGTTPASHYNTARSKLSNIMNAFDTIKAKLNKTLSFVDQFNDGFLANANCTILRRELNNLETTICFDFNYSLYNFTALVTFIVFFLFLFSWMICCALRCLPTADITVDHQKAANDPTFYMRDNEEAPVY